MSEATEQTRDAPCYNSRCQPTLLRLGWNDEGTNSSGSKRNGGMVTSRIHYSTSTTARHFTTQPPTPLGVRSDSGECNSYRPMVNLTLGVNEEAQTGSDHTAIHYTIANASKSCNRWTGQRMPELEGKESILYWDEELLALYDKRMQSKETCQRHRTIWGPYPNMWRGNIVLLTTHSSIG